MASVIGHDARGLLGSHTALRSSMAQMVPVGSSSGSELQDAML
jgi:hypothetical protein